MEIPKRGFMRDKAPLLCEIWDFLRMRKKWWLTPIIVMLLLTGLLIWLGATTPVSPFIYPLV